MTDNNEGFVTKDDLQVMLAALKQESDNAWTVKETKLKEEFDLKANQIHSYYAKKLKKAGINEDETPEDEKSEPRRKPSKTEVETQEAVQALLKRAEEADKREAEAKRQLALEKQRSTVSDLLTKNGINPKALDLVHRVLDASSALTEDGKWKVKVDNIEVPLPLDQAVKHFVKSPEAEFFLAPSGAKGTGTVQSNPTKSTNGVAKPRVEIDWEAVGADLVGVQK